jgi:hypothetical protein
MSGFWHDARVRARACEIWEQTGRPENKDVEHWLQAEAEITQQEQALDEEVKLESEGVV